MWPQSDCPSVRLLNEGVGGGSQHSFSSPSPQKKREEEGKIIESCFGTVGWTWHSKKEDPSLLFWSGAYSSFFFFFEEAHFLPFIFFSFLAYCQKRSWKGGPAAAAVTAAAAAAAAAVDKDHFSFSLSLELLLLLPPLQPYMEKGLHFHIFFKGPCTRKAFFAAIITKSVFRLGM